MAPDGKLTTVQKVKLSMKSESGVQQASWVGSSLLATSSAEEPYIRCVARAHTHTHTHTPHAEGTVYAHTPVNGHVTGCANGEGDF